jgi:hypothetical protein
MRALVLALALVACGNKHDEPKATPAADLSACAATIGKLAGSPPERVLALIQGWQVCGDWKPILEWATPQQDGGPKRAQILERMGQCQAWCNSNAKDFFTATLDDARGTSQRVPWKQLAEQCKDKVSAVPDGRYVSAPYFALDRIARAAGKDEKLSAALVEVTLQLPPTSATGAPIDVAETSSVTEPVPDNARLVTVLGDALYLSSPQLAHLAPTGVVLVANPLPPYPGKQLAAGELPALEDIVVIAPKAMPANKLFELLAPVKGGVRLAVKTHVPLAGWIDSVPLHRKAPVDDKTTVQDLLAPLPP